MVRGGHLLLALLSSDDLAPLARDASRQLELIAPAKLADELPGILAPKGGADDGEAQDGAAATTPSGKSQALDKYCIDLTARARAG